MNYPDLVSVQTALAESRFDRARQLLGRKLHLKKQIALLSSEDLQQRAIAALYLQLCLSLLLSERRTSSVLHFARLILLNSAPGEPVDESIRLVNYYALITLYLRASARPSSRLRNANEELLKRAANLDSRSLRRLEALMTHLVADSGRDGDV